jgi:ABC-type dipeptide/oligopeptide/nickel transport system ATPase component
MKQRIVIAMALAGEPDLIIADEPTTALDVTVQAQIIQILGALVRERGLALLLITHDMGVMAQVCDRVAVLYAGRWPRRRRSADLRRAAHPYTAALIGCIPREGMAQGQPARHSGRRCPRPWPIRPAAGSTRAARAPRTCREQSCPPNGPRAGRRHGGLPPRWRARMTAP